MFQFIKLANLLRFYFSYKIIYYQSKNMRKKVSEIKIDIMLLEEKHLELRLFTSRL